MAAAVPGTATAATANPYLRSPPPPRWPFGERARSPLGVAKDPRKAAGGRGRFAPCLRGLLYAVTPPHPPEDGGTAGPNSQWLAPAFHVRRPRVCLLSPLAWGAVS
jgi:hypothetical protein